MERKRQEDNRNVASESPLLWLLLRPDEGRRGDFWGRVPHALWAPRWEEGLC